MAIVHCACGDPSGPEDAGSDGSIDAMDSAADGSGADAGGHVDAETDGAVAEWVRLPGLPAECMIDRAVSPEGAVSLAWEACAGGVAGCTVLAGTHLAMPEVGVFTGEGGYFWILDRIDEGEMRHVVARTNGPPVAVFRAPDNTRPGVDVCALASIAMTSDTATFKARAPEWIGSEHVFVMSYDAPEAVAQVDVLDASTLGTSTIVSTAGSAELVSFDFQPGSRLFAVSDSTRVEIPAVGGAPFHPLIVGQHLLWSELSDRIRISHRAVDGTSETYVQSDAGDILDTLVDGSDVIFELAIPTYATMGPYELWAGSYARNSVDFAPRRVVVLPHNITPVLGGGKVAYRDDSTTPASIAVVDLESRVTRRYVPPAGYSVASEPMIAVSTGAVLLRVTNGPDSETVMILDLALTPFEEIPASP